MSRFKDLSPRNIDRSHSITSDTSPEDEIINSILRKRQQRQPHLASPDLIGKTTDSQSTTSNDSIQSHASGSPTPKATRTNDPITNKTPYSMLKRLANVNAVRDKSQDPDRPPMPSKRESYAESYVSHTTSSINEASAILVREEVSKCHDSPRSLLSISKMMAKEKSRNSDTMEFTFHEPAPPPPSSRDEKLEAEDLSTAKPNRTLFTPLPIQERPRSRDIAEGYISPPQSRQTSPQDSGVPAAAEKCHNASMDGSPSPTTLRKFPEPGTLDLQTPSKRPTGRNDAMHGTNSPRSRLTRTLLEIQAELAESREGIEAIESRLEVLEQHQSVDRDMLQKHVEDCLHRMADELNSSIDTSGVYDQSMTAEAGENLESAINSETLMLESTDTQTIPGLGEASISHTKDGLIVRFVLPAKVVMYSICGVLVAEWVITSILSELGRRQVLVLS